MGRLGGAASVLVVLAAAAMLLWPAALNGYPLLFGDTGVYVEDGIHLHASWARPLFYGLFMLPLHLELTTWPVVAGQALIAALGLLAGLRGFLPKLSPLLLLPVTAALAMLTSLPWFVSQLMPDLFGGLLVIALSLLVLRPVPLRWPADVGLVLFSAACITFHLSFVPLSAAVIVVLLLCRLILRRPLRAADWLRALSAPCLAVSLVVAANAALIGQASFSPYGKIFILARLLADGPAQRALERECPRPDWSLCAVKDAIPVDEDAILWGEDSVLNRAGGYRAVAAQAWPVVRSAVRAEPGTVLAQALRNTAVQFASFRSGDALLRPASYNERTWTNEFPAAERARYHAGRQFRRLPLVPEWLQAIHVGYGWLSVALVAFGAWTGLRRRQALGGFYAACLTALVANAFVAGALSGVYDRYQSRFIWLAGFAAVMMLLERQRLTARSDVLVEAR